MRKSFFSFTILIAFFLVFLEKVEAGNINFTPQTPGTSKKVDAINIETISASHRLATLSLQGLVNRDGGKIYTYVHQDKWIFDLYQEQEYIIEVEAHTEFATLLEKYKTVPKGAVVYDPNKRFTVNIATNVAGVEDRIILAPDMVDNFKATTGIEDILDLRTHNFASRLEAFRWYKSNIFPHQNHNMLAVSKDLVFMYDVYRDYMVEFKLPVFWLPGKNDNDYDPEYDKEIRLLLKETPVNIPVLGFWQGTENGKDIGYTEYDGVSLGGYYGKFTLVNTWVGNYSFHSGIKPTSEIYEQVKPKEKQFREYNPNKHYVALIMNESGDAPCYFLYTGFFPRQWNDPDRGKVAISYGITPSLQTLAPGILRHIYDTQTENDYFFTSISGIGYCYPFEGYCDSTDTPDVNKRSYFSMTSENMKKLDLTMLGIYTHPAKKWTAQDKSLAKKYIFPMDSLQSVISGMHRVGYTGKDSHEINEQVTTHHTITHWPQVDYTWTDEKQDDAAVRFMETEIKTYGYGGNFTQAMFYSWMYGPRRLNKLREAMEPQGYEFVTLDEFDYLCRIAKDWIPFGSGVSENVADGNEKVRFNYNTKEKTLCFSESLNGSINIFDLKGNLVSYLELNDTMLAPLPFLVGGVYILEVDSDKAQKISGKIMIK